MRTPGRRADSFHPLPPGSPDRAKLTAEQLAAMEVVDLGRRGPNAPLVAQARDYFLFAFYAAGVRYSDIASMKWSDIVLSEAADGASEALVSYTMGKTGKRISVRVGSAAAELVRA